MWFRFARSAQRQPSAPAARARVGPDSLLELTGLKVRFAYRCVDRMRLYSTLFASYVVIHCVSAIPETSNDSRWQWRFLRGTAPHGRRLADCTTDEGVVFRDG